MKISELPYYVKFVFQCNDGACYSTADIAMLKHIKNPGSEQRVFSLDVGDRIVFDPNREKVYRIAEVAIRHLLDDTDMMRVGFDSEDCTAMQGRPKEWLLKVLIKAERELAASIGAICSVDVGRTMRSSEQRLMGLSPPSGGTQVIKHCRIQSALRWLQNAVQAFSDLVEHGLGVCRF